MNDLELGVLGTGCRRSKDVAPDERAARADDPPVATKHATRALVGSKDPRLGRQ